MDCVLLHRSVRARSWKSCDQLLQCSSRSVCLRCRRRITQGLAYIHRTDTHRLTARVLRSSCSRLNHHRRAACSRITGRGSMQRSAHGGRFAHLHPARNVHPAIPLLGPAAGAADTRGTLVLILRRSIHRVPPTTDRRRPRCKSVTLQIDGRSFSYINHALHTDHRCGCGACGALGAAHGLRIASSCGTCYVGPK